MVKANSKTAFESNDSPNSHLKRDVLALHGFSGCGADFSLFESGTFDRFNWAQPNLPGHDGSTDLPARTFSLKLFFEGLLGKLNAPVIGLGYSMGGRFLLQAAVSNPAYFTDLILIGSSPGLSDSKERRTRKERDDALAQRIRTGGVRRFLKEWIDQPLLCSQKMRIPKDHFKDMQANRSRHSAEGLARSLENHGTGALPSLWSQLHTLTLPVCLVVGEEDLKFKAIARQMLSVLPNAQLIILPNAGHAAHLENPPAFTEFILEKFG